MPYNMVIVSPNEKKKKKKKGRLTSKIGCDKAITKNKQQANQLIFLHWVKRINSK